MPIEETTRKGPKWRNNRPELEFWHLSQEPTIGVSGKRIWDKGQSMEKDEKTWMDFIVNVDAGYKTNEILVRVDEDSEIRLPEELGGVAEAIETSRYLYNLDDNWDDEGSPGYSFKTWKRTVDFVAKYSIRALETFSIIVTVPAITEGPEGSLDILWRNEDFSLLVNVPEEEAITFFGKDGNNYIKGSVADLRDPNFGLIHCLARI